MEETPTEAAEVAQATPAMTEDGGAAVPMEDPLTWTPEKIGGTVTVLAIWGGEELANFQAMIAAIPGRNRHRGSDGNHPRSGCSIEHAHPGR